MRIMLLDDERLALTGLERLLRAYEELTIVGMYQNARQALDEITDIQPDVIFLDIHMPEITGIEAVSLFQERSPGVDIVFVTAYDEYAVQAFELNAVDYLLKPLSRTRLDKTINRLLGSKRSTEQAAEPLPSNGVIGITAFHTLRVMYANKTSKLLPWRTAKAQELFAYLLHNRGEIVRKSTLLELMWPEELDLKRAMTQLYTTVYLVRQCLSKAGVDIEVKNLSIQEGYVLDASRITVEPERWEQELSALHGPIEHIHAELKVLLNRYEGDYLGEYDYVWAENERERLFKLWLQHMRSLIHYYANEGASIEEAIILCERIAARDCYNEEYALLLVELYGRAGKADKACEYYEYLKRIFREELYIDLPESIVEWSRSKTT